MIDANIADGDLLYGAVESKYSLRNGDIINARFGLGAT